MTALFAEKILSVAFNFLICDYRSSELLQIVSVIGFSSYLFAGEKKERQGRSL
jgi:hypothetical protein